MHRTRNRLSTYTQSCLKCLPVAAGLFLLCLPRAAICQEADTPGLAAPAAVTGRAALSRDDLAHFITVNRVAEPRRQAAADALFEEHLGAAKAPLGPALFIILADMNTRTRRINSDACRETGVDCREYGEVARRILQVNELGWLELRQQAIADRSRRLEAAQKENPRARALESWYALHEVETRGYEVGLHGIEQRLQAGAMARKHRRERSQARARERLRSMDGVRTQLGALKALREEREHLLLDPRFAASRDSLKLEIEKLDAMITRFDRKLSPIESAAVREPGPDETVDASAPQLLEAQRALDEQRSKRPSDAELADLEAGLRKNLLAEEQKIAAEAKQLRPLLASATTQQARLDRPAVFERLPDLVYLGKPLVMPPPVLAAPDPAR